MAYANNIRNMVSNREYTLGVDCWKTDNSLNPYEFDILEWLKNNATDYIFKHDIFFFVKEEYDHFMKLVEHDKKMRFDDVRRLQLKIEELKIEIEPHMVEYENDLRIKMEAELRKKVNNERTKQINDQIKLYYKEITGRDFYDPVAV